MKGMNRMAILRNSWERMAVMAVATALLGGCVTVTAPDKPIVINLNINIKQEVVYRLDGKAKEVIDENAEIF
jgi:hypothetical protein